MLKKLVHDTSAVAMVEFAICVPILIFMYISTFVISDMINCDRKVATANSTLGNLASRNLSPSNIWQGIFQANVAGVPPLANSMSLISTYLGDSTYILFPYPVVNATETVAQVRVCNPTQAYIVWSQTQTQNADGSANVAAPTLGSAAATLITLPANLIAPSANQASYYPLAPSSDGVTNVDTCSNPVYTGGNPATIAPQGSDFFMVTVTYHYTSAIGLGSPTIMTMSNTLYVVPLVSPQQNG